MKYNFSSIILIFGVVILFSCKKESTNQLPIIEVVSPVQNQQFNSPDSIPVVATIQDDKGLKVIKINVTDENFIAIQSPEYIFPSSNSYTVNMKFYVDGTVYNSGNYYLQIRAEDETDYRNAYIPIYINASPTEFEQALVITQKSSSVLGLYGFTLNQSPTQLYTFNGDYTSSEINSKGKQLYISGAIQLNLLAFNLDNLNIDWQLEQVPFQPMHNINCLYFDEYLFSTFFSDYIYAYDASSAIVFNSDVEETESPAVIWRHNNYVLADFQRTNNGQTFIKTMFTLTGLEKQRLLTNYEVVGFHTQQDENVLITANDETQGRVILYDISQNLSTEIVALNAKIKCSETAENGEVVIGSEGGLFYFNPLQWAVISVNGSLSANKLSYDDLNNLLYVAVNNKVEIYTWPEMVNQKTLPFSDTILEIHLQFTK